MYKIYRRADLVHFAKTNKVNLQTLLDECRAFMKYAEEKSLSWNEEVRFMSNHARMDYLRNVMACGLKYVEKLPCYKRDVPLLRAMYLIEAQCKGDMEKPKTRPYWMVHGSNDRYCFDNFNSNSIHLMTLGEQGMPRTATLTYDTEQKKWICNPGVLAAYFPSLDKVFTDMSIGCYDIPVTKYALNCPWAFADLSTVFNKSLQNGFTPRDIDKLRWACVHLLDGSML